MKGILQSLINESKGNDTVSSVNSNTSEKKTGGSEVLPTELSGDFLLSGCNDWTNSTSKTPGGLDEIHRVELGSKVKSSFSSSSSMHSFLLMADGSIRGMGRNDHGQLATGDTNTIDLPVTVDLPSLSPVVKICTGRSHTLVLFQNGEVWGCGSNAFGQLGLGSGKAITKDIMKFTKITFPSDDSVIRDIACGYDFSLVCSSTGKMYSFGHPEYGVLGRGDDGRFIKDGGKGAAVQFSCEYTPKLIDKFITKDNHGKVTATRNYDQIRIRSVAAGKNHAACVEEWDETTVFPQYTPANRVYTWGWGGYGRLGHNGPQDEFFPREVTAFSHFIPSPNNPTERLPAMPSNRQKQIREIICGSSFTLAISATRHLYYWGKMSNAPRGEATVYPQMQQELFDYPVRSCAVGSNLIVVIAGMNNRATGVTDGYTQGPSYAIAWGMPVAGKLGFEGGAKSSTHPKMLSRLSGLDLEQVCCGYGQVSWVVSPETPAAAASSAGSSAGTENVLASFPVLQALPSTVSGSKKKKGGAAESAQGKGAVKKARK